MPKINKDKCIGCGACEAMCPAEAIKVDSNGKREIDQEKCVHCGMCASVCPVNACEQD